MSIKIYNGWICPSNDLGQEIERFHAIRPRVREIGREVQARWCAIKASEYLDDAHQKGETIAPVRMRVIIDLMDRQAEIEKTKYRDPLDCTSSVVLIPSQGAILACVYAENKDINAALTSGMDYFGYWNNSDRPEDLDEEEWDRRKECWEKALARDPFSRPAGCGPVIEFMPDHTIISQSDIFNHLPDKDMRAKRLARLDMLARHITPFEKTLTPGKIVQITMSPKYQEELESLTQSLIPHLLDITIEHL